VEEARPSLARRLLAVLVLVVAGYLLLKLVIGLVTAVAGLVAVVVAIAAIVWAIRTL
jgi:hypothetical protein